MPVAIRKRGLHRRNVTLNYVWSHVKTRDIRFPMEEGTPMAASLAETLEEVAAQIPRYSWEIMDEEQRDALMEGVVLPRYMKVTADGVELGPTAWGKMLGASASAIRNRVFRLQQKDKQAAGTRSAPERSDFEKQQLRYARAVLKSPEMARELLADPTVRAVAAEAIQREHRRQEPPPRPSAPTGDDAFLRCIEDMSRMEQAALRLVENLNEGRRNGYLTPSVLREFADKVRLWADAIDDIAGSRGLTDDALAEWIGG